MMEIQTERQDPSEPVEVKITGVSISFMDLMVLIFRATLAAIPALMLAAAAIFMFVMVLRTMSSF